MATRYLVQLFVEGKIVYMFVSAPDETVPEIRKRVQETIALTMTSYDDEAQEEGRFIRIVEGD